MEKFMDHYGNVAAERKLRTPGSKRRPAKRFLGVGGVHGVGGGANDRFILLLCAAAASSSKVRARWWPAWR
ncbi:hypothetical protein PR003_g29987 [Phytophthora rubi]|uniref:Uncharacterized protein n=1 Tax=Phytophthora rubi TaxID=129364 RepID=A0A6A4BHQ5_9STRA|nr:hypothetical protein PR003_g29987 [Phytophthora rubi]